MKRMASLFLALSLFLLPAAYAEGVEPVTMTDAARGAASLFLSNFTEIGMDSISTDSDDMALVDFAHDHLWFNDYESYEYGEYFDGNNCRVPDGRILEIIEKYFYDPGTDIDIAQTRFDYRDGYYYHVETGGWTDCGFAVATDIWALPDGLYFISFMVFGGGDAWDNSVMGMTAQEACSAYGHPTGYGSALVHAEDIEDRSTYKLVSFGKV